MVILPVAWREQLARERCASDLLDGETLDAADGFRIFGRRLRGPGLVVDLWTGAAAGRKKKERRQRCTEYLGTKNAALENGNCDSV